jgi:hypothetical protein
MCMCLDLSLLRIAKFGSQRKRYKSGSILF